MKEARDVQRDDVVRYDERPHEGGSLESSAEPIEDGGVPAQAPG